MHMSLARAAVISGVFVLLLLPSAVAIAQSQFVGGVPAQIVTCSGADCDLCKLAELIQNILNLLVYVAVVGAALLFAYAGWLMLSSAENPGQRNTGKQIFTNVVIGLVIILGGWLAVDTLMKSVLSGGFGPWNQICSASYNSGSAGLEF